MQQFNVQKDDDDIRLDRWFKRHYPNLPTAQVQKACRKGLIRVNGSKADAAQHIAVGQSISVKFIDLGAAKPKLKKNELSAQQASEAQKWVLHKSSDCLVINKPAGLAVQGGSGQTDYVDARLPALQFDAGEPPKLVHRLDKDTSGALLLARSSGAAAAYAKLFAGRGVQKIYLALVVGVPVPREGEIESKLEKSGAEGFEKMRSAAIDESGKKAVTHYRVLDYAHEQVALVELQPITGRTHQLRVHMAEFGFPILGDGKYGREDAFIEGLDLPKQLHLHAHRLVIDSKGLDVTAPLPKHMKQSLQQLGFER